MDIATLAAKQKRANDWSEFIAHGGAQDPVVRRAIEERLATFRGALKRVWEAGSIGAADAAEIADLERQLVQLNEEARVRVVGRQTASNSAPRRA
jgi:hypothetical protein